MKTIIKTMLVALIAMLMANGCGGGGGDSAETGKLIIKSVELKDSL